MALRRRPHQTADMNKVKAKPDGRGYDIEPKGLNIVWGNDPRYWSIPENGPARLVQAFVMKVSGTVTVEKGRKYRLTFKVLLKDDSFGWDGSPVWVAAKVGNGGYNYEKVSLHQTPQPIDIPSSDGGLLIQVGENEVDPQVHFGLYEFGRRNWKGGLEIYSASLDTALDQ